MSTWGLRKTLGALAVAAAVAGIGGAAISAAAGGGYHGESHRPGPNQPPQASPQHVASAPQDALHGEFVESDGNGHFVTRMIQTGRVTAISTTEVTARSDDGFSRTYAIREAEGAPPPPFSVGQLVTIGATREGEADLVDTIRPPLAPGS